MAAAYYQAKIDSLRDIFGTDDIHVEDQSILVSGTRYPVVDDVIVLLSPEEYPEYLKDRMRSQSSDVDLSHTAQGTTAVQRSFGSEWTSFPEILPEHMAEFYTYFDLIPLESLEGKRVCDLGCGIGRWSSFVREHCREVVLVDFSEAIFVARENLRNGKQNAIFFMGDLQKLPFREQFADFLFCLGVLHHLPVDCLRATRSLRRYSPLLLIYLYYDLENRPLHFRLLWRVSDWGRRLFCLVRWERARMFLSWLITVTVYVPFVYLGKILSTVGLDHLVPIYEGHKADTWRRICQDCYDRFFTPIEQRVSRDQIYTLKDTFSEVIVDDDAPYWHFLLRA